MFYRFLSGLVAFLFSAGAAYADKPVPWQMTFQEPATPIMEHLVQFHNLLLVVIWSSGIFVFLLLVYVCIRFSAKNNPVPSKTSHNTLIEIIWTTVPIIILVLLCIPSMKNLYFIERIKDTEMTLKVIGNQWYWTYQYPDNGNISFDSNILKDEELKENDIRLLSVDNKVVLPINTKIKIQATSVDVIHDWGIPSFATKIDAVPGKLNEAWIEIERPGVYYGQCSELCGAGHGFMPIEVEAVSKEDFAKWVVQAKKKFASSTDSEVASK